jgi:hypothetical protein
LTESPLHSQSGQEVQRYLPQTTSLQRTLSYCICANAQSSGVRAHTEKKKFCLLVLNSVTSPPRWIRQPQLRAMHGVCFFVLFLEASHPADVSAPVFSGTSAFSLRLMPSRLTPCATSALTVSSTLPPLPLLALRARPFHLPPPPRLLLYTPYVIT